MAAANAEKRPYLIYATEFLTIELYHYAKLSYRRKFLIIK
jgi:hypothetical protein